MNILPFLLVAVGINLALFAVAFRRQTDKLTDVSYALTFVVLALWGLLTSDQQTGHALVAAMVTVWAIRLGGFLLYRIRHTGKDARFDAMRNSFWSFGKFWLLQGVSVWVIMLSASELFASEAAHITTISYGGIVVWLLGVVLEATADIQKYRFTSNPAHKGQWIDQGVWHYSRHPNYLGEILTWVGVYLFAAPFLSAWALIIAAASPLYISGLLLFVSGIPILEKAADERWGKDSRYQHYKQHTGVLLPWHKK